jgi:hypothetical protein
MKCIPNRIFEFARVLCSPTRIFLRYNCLRGHAIINSSCPQKGDSNDISLSFLCGKKERKSSSFLIGTPIYYLLLCSCDAKYIHLLIKCDPPIRLHDEVSIQWIMPPCRKLKYFSFHCKLSNEHDWNLTAPKHGLNLCIRTSR